MGYSLSWIALKPASLEQACAMLDLKQTGVYEDVCESPYTGACLKNGWTVVVSEHSKTIFCANKTLISRVPPGIECVAVFLEEHVMCSSVECWLNGRVVWSVEHASDSGLLHLEAKGQLPPLYNEITAKLMAEQKTAGGKKARVDYVFEIPIETAKSVTGYRHDEELEADPELKYEVLKPLHPPKEQSFFRRLLGF